MKPPTEAAGRARFDQIRYAQCWEDADVLLEALDIQPGDICLSIASAGDNSFSLLTRDPSKVIALDLNPAQLACVWLRKAAYATLTHAELLQLIGATSGDQRANLYMRCRPSLPPEVQAFWDARPDVIEAGIGTGGKFEAYFRLFRSRVIPWVHSRKTIDQLLTDKSRDERRSFYDNVWNNRRWRLMYKLFFSRFVMGRLGRDPAFFKYAEGSVAARLFRRSEHALVELNPADNPYLQWILTGRFNNTLPHALRVEHFDSIRRNLDRLEIRLASVEQYLAEHSTERIDRFNLSDIFEYMSIENYGAMLDTLIARSNRCARLVYWNMLVPRSRPSRLADRLRDVQGSQADQTLGDELLLRDKAFFYSRFVVEEVL